MVGTWNVSSSCLDLSSSNLDIGPAGLDPSACKNVTLAGSLAVTGTWTANANGTYTDGTTTSGNVQIGMPAGCLKLSGTTVTCDGITGPLAGMGFANGNCTPAAGGGCTCTATVQQMGGIAWLTADPQNNGNYTTSSNILTADGIGGVRVLRRGQQHDLDAAEHEPDHVGHDRVRRRAARAERRGTSGCGGHERPAGTSGRRGTGGRRQRGRRHERSAGTGGAVRAARRAAAAAGAAATRWHRRHGRRGRRRRHDAARPARPARAARARAASTDPATSTRPPNTPCGAAYSMVRALSKSYTGPLYQVRSGSSAMNTGSGGT